MSAETLTVRRMLTEFDDIESRLIRLSREYPPGAPHAAEVKAATKRILQGFGATRKVLDAIAYSNHDNEQRELRDSRKRSDA